MQWFNSTVFRFVLYFRVFFRPKNFYGPSDNIQKMSGQTFNYGYLVHTRNFWRWLFKRNLIHAYKREWAQNATYNIIVFFMVWLQLNWHENRDIVSLKFVITACWKFKIKVKTNGIFIILHKNYFCMKYRKSVRSFL